MMHTKSTKNAVNNDPTIPLLHYLLIICAFSSVSHNLYNENK